MPRQLRTQGGQRYALHEFELPAPGPGEVRVRARFAALKQGTESHLLAGSVFDCKQWDAELRLFRPRPTVDKPTAETPATDKTAEMPVGNMVVGDVTALGAGVTRFRVGDAVFGYGSVCDEHQAAEEHWLPLGTLSPEMAVCVDPAHVALVAVRDGNVRIGDAVAVYGLGAIGLLAVQLARAGGAQQVFAVDPLPARRAHAEAHGATASLDPETCDAALKIKLATGKKGVDVAIETSGNGRAFHDAIRCIRQCGTIVHVPWGPKDGTHLHFNEEFHLNRPTIVGSQAVWDNPDRDYPLWDKARAYQTVIDLFENGTLTAEGLVTPIIPFEATPSAADLLFNPAQSIKTGVVFA